MHRFFFILAALWGIFALGVAIGATSRNPWGWALTYAILAGIALVLAIITYARGKRAGQKKGEGQ